MTVTPATVRRLAPLLAISVVLVGAFVGYQRWDRAREGEFGTDPRACSLVPAETVHRLVPLGSGGRADGPDVCTWSTPRSENGGSRRPSIHLLAFRYDVAGARKEFRRAREDGLGWEPGSVRELPGIGDEAYVRFRTSVERYLTAEVAFRRSNVVVTVQYARPDLDRAAARAGAVAAATDAAAALGR